MIRLASWYSQCMCVGDLIFPFFQELNDIRASGIKIFRNIEVDEQSILNWQGLIVPVSWTRRLHIDCVILRRACSSSCFLFRMIFFDIMPTEEKFFAVWNKLSFMWLWETNCDWDQLFFQPRSYLSYLKENILWPLFTVFLWRNISLSVKVFILQPWYRKGLTFTCPAVKCSSSFTGPYVSPVV